jgi:hypothetical protein
VLKEIRKDLGDGKYVQCPCCTATMDKYGFTFAFRIMKDGEIFFCNNPLCDGIQRSELTIQSDKPKDLGTAMP